VGLTPWESESHDAWAGFLSDLLGRGLVPPLLVVSDGAPGLIGACEVVLSKSLRQRCLIHRARNVLAKVPKSAQAEVKAEFWKIFDDIDAPAGQEAVDLVRGRIARFEKRYGTEYPAAVKCLTTDVASLTVYLRFPKEHWKRIRHSNFIERTFGETRRRVKVIGRLPGERSCLSLVWAVLDRASAGWRGVKHTPATTRLLADLRRQLLEPPRSIASIPTDDSEENTVTAVA
jgi:transposase-like protein